MFLNKNSNLADIRVIVKLWLKQNHFFR